MDNAFQLNSHQLKPLDDTVQAAKEQDQTENVFQLWLLVLQDKSWDQLEVSFVFYSISLIGGF